MKFVKILLSCIADLIEAEIDGDAEKERQALLKMQRLISDEIASREAQGL